jgi:hypothetical protein
MSSVRATVTCVCSPALNPAALHHHSPRKVLVASTKRVMLFTNNMTPLCGGSDGSTAIERSRLLQQTGIYVHVVPLASSPPGSTFYKVSARAYCARMR